MYANELVKRLQEQINEHGDAYVCIEGILFNEKFTSTVSTIKYYEDGKIKDFEDKHFRLYWQTE